MDMLSTREAAERLGLAHHQTVVKLVERGLLQAEWNEKRTRLRISTDEIERYQRERRPAHRPRSITMEAKLTRIVIVDDDQRERYQLVYEYSDGTQSDPQGSYATFEQAYEEVRYHGDPAFAGDYEQVPIEDRAI